MPTLAIDKDFLLDLGKLDKPVQERVSEVFEKFEAGTHAGVHLEKIANARNLRFRSIRINQFWRGIVLAPQSGDTYTLLKVLPHDWAKRRDLSVNRATGGIEIRDEAALTESLERLTTASTPATTPLFAAVSDKDLTHRKSTGPGIAWTSSATPNSRRRYCCLLTGVAGRSRRIAVAYLLVLARLC